MSIHLYPRDNKKFSSAQYSTKPQQNASSSRVFLLYRQEGGGSKTSRAKVYNLNDSQRRIKREHNKLLKQSTEQSALFEKGIKKINPKSQQKQLRKQSNIKRSYRNKQTHNIINPTPITETKFITGGVRKIYLYDQNRTTTKEHSSSKKSLIKDRNIQSKSQDNSEVYLLNKLPTHKGAARQWINQIATMKFQKKENHSNKQNMNENVKQQRIKKSFRQGLSNIKNKSQLMIKENGITLDVGLKTGKLIDFDQNYYQKYERLGNQQHSRSIYLRYR